MHSGEWRKDAIPFRPGSPSSDKERPTQSALPSIRHLTHPSSASTAQTVPPSDLAPRVASTAASTDPGSISTLESTSAPNPTEHLAPVSPTEPPKKKRRRQALSCTECKRRKIKCDRAHPCGPCARRGEPTKCQWHVFEPVYVHLPDSNRSAPHTSTSSAMHSLPTLPPRPAVPDQDSDPIMEYSSPAPVPAALAGSSVVTRAEFDELKLKVQYLEGLIQRLTSGHTALEDPPPWAHRRANIIDPSRHRHMPSPQLDSTGFRERPGTSHAPQSSSLPLSPSNPSSQPLGGQEVGPNYVHHQIPLTSSDRGSIAAVSPRVAVTGDTSSIVMPPPRYPVQGTQSSVPDSAFARAGKRSRTASMSSITYSQAPTGVSTANPHNRAPPGTSSGVIILPTPPGGASLPPPSELLRRSPAGAARGGRSQVSRPISPIPKRSAPYPAGHPSASPPTSRAHNVSPVTTRRHSPSEAVTTTSQINEAVSSERQGWSSTSRKPLSGPEHGHNVSLPPISTRLASPEPHMSRRFSDPMAYDRITVPPASRQPPASVRSGNNDGEDQTMISRNASQEEGR